MRKIMWWISWICLAGTALVLQFLPMRVPMHYNAAGEVNRWGSKYECLIFPVLILLNSLLWHCVSRYYEKKALHVTDEKEAAEAKNNAKIIGIVGIVTAIMHTVLQGALLYASNISAGADTRNQMIDVTKVSIILAGVITIIIGNFMTKTRVNYFMGFRTKWSMYNDATWRKSNHFGAIGIMIAGMTAILSTVILDGERSMFVSLIVLTVVTIATYIYSYKVYLQERAADEPHRES